MGSAPTELTVKLLERQLRDGFTRLRFGKVLEPIYREHHVVDVMNRRMVLIISAMLMILVLPILDRFLLHPPAEMLPHMRRVQWTVMLPALLLAAVVTALPRWRHFSDWAGMMAAMAVALGVIYHRHLAEQFGWSVPTEFIGATLAGVLLIGGLGFYRVLPVAVAIWGAFAISEFSLYGQGSEVHYRVYGMLTIAVICVVGGYLEEYGARAGWLRQQLLLQLSRRDSLTDLLNHRAFHERYEQTFSVALRDSRPLMVALIDVDDFKGFNDQYGHAAGDDCLRAVSEVLGRSARRGADLVGRVGGEEFAVAWYGIKPADAEAALERLRNQVQQLQIPHQANRSGAGVVTVSIGAHCAMPTSSERADRFLRIADERLYRAKDNGRNQVSMGQRRGESSKQSDEGLRLVGA